MPTLLYIRLVDQMNDSTLHARADTARGNWSVAPGPQLLSFNATNGDSITYLKRDDSIPAPNGITANYNSSGANCTSTQCNIYFSNIWVPLNNKNYSVATAIFAHELGHSLGMAHHSPSDPAVMNQGTTLEGPTQFDTGPVPLCSGITNSYMGIRCIYNWDL